MDILADVVDNLAVKLAYSTSLKLKNINSKMKSSLKQEKEKLALKF